ncbi:MAG TPA: DUF6445 family protein [Vicinamibacterales bacterium]|nr:DUF6445 family protein [Vicinamibacterales bacterium]
MADLTHSALRICDDVIADPVAYTAAVRRLPFQTLDLGGSVFHGIAACDDPELAEWVVAHYPHARPGLTFYRQSADGQVEPNYIHADAAMGEWTGILYLTERSPARDGTIFWEDRLTGARMTTATTDAERAAEWAAWRQLDQWQAWAHVEARPNRLLLFPAACYHSRAIPENYGHGATARLIQVMFGTGSLRRDE